MGEDVNQTSNPNPAQEPKAPKKSGKGLFIFVAILLIAIVGLVGYILIDKGVIGGSSAQNTTSTSEKKESKNTSKKNSSKKNTTKDDDDDDDDEDKDKKKKDDEDKKKKDKNETSDKENKTDKDNTTKENKTDKDNTAKENKTDDNKTNDKKTGSANISSDWKSGEFALDGVKYSLNCDYSEYTKNGWYVDYSKFRDLTKDYILNKNDKLLATIDFSNKKFEACDVNIGFKNLTDSPKSVEETSVWAITVDNKFAKNKVDFELPGGVKYGSTLAEVEAAYGKPEKESDIYRADSLGYYTYTYSNDNAKPSLTLTIYDDLGVTKFEYRHY